jgi:apolipoprotein N-acyltransferase
MKAFLKQPTSNTTIRTAALLALCVAAMSLAFAPIGQFYLAWVGLVPLLLAMRNLKSRRRAFFWGWGAGTAFFLANLWWLEYVTLAGTAALAVYLGVFWGFAAVLIRGCALLGRWDAASGVALSPKRPVRCALLVAAMWCGLEWLRGSYSLFGAHGLPWLYVGYSQTPALPLCQIADITGVYGVSFWVVLINAVGAICWIDRANLAKSRNAQKLLLGVTAVVTSYGLFRINQHTTRQGPTVLVVQCNYPQSISGEKGASLNEIVDFHVRRTMAALTACQTKGEKVDLVVWSETMMPPLNDASQVFFQGLSNLTDQTPGRLSDLADRYRTSLLVGSTFANGWHWTRDKDGHVVPESADHRNSAYLFGPTGIMAPERYDKIQLLPFGEFIPFRDSIPWLYRLLVSLGPPDMKSYELMAGSPDALTVFRLQRIEDSRAAGSGALVMTQAGRFVVPICFEDIVAPLVDDLMWGPHGRRADFMVNITNDGWFPGSERAEHLQAAAFRSIEHRVPTARSVNTGISGFIDSNGRTSDLVAAGTEGWSVKQLQLDDRTTVYSRMGDAFARLCMAVTVGIGLYGGWDWIKGR